jgi:hypothetical protein
MNTTENNKLLAEFLGLTLEQEQERIFIQGLGTKLIEETFNTDWNWLMEVVEKIESLGYISNQDSRICEGSLKPIYYFRIFIKHYRGQNVGYSKANTRIEAVYNACVEFVKWYNENK